MLLQAGCKSTPSRCFARDRIEDIPHSSSFYSLCPKLDTYHYHLWTGDWKYHLFVLVNVFLGSIVTGTTFQQLDSFMHQSATNIPVIVGETIHSKAIFFIIYIMVDGWAGVAVGILRLSPLIVFHLKNAFLVKTERY